MNQGLLPFLDPTLPVPMPAARAKDPMTSHKAAEGAKVFAPSQKEQILEALRIGPASKTEISRRTGINDVAVARRCSELVKERKVLVLSEDGVSASGNVERVYGLPWQAMRAGS
jgi:hypothetical protein